MCELKEGSVVGVWFPFVAEESAHHVTSSPFFTITLSTHLLASCSQQVTIASSVDSLLQEISMHHLHHSCPRKDEPRPLTTTTFVSERRTVTQLPSFNDLLKNSSNDTL